jgi:glycosyltransferase involved in cell wall biosynthesis
MRVWIVVPAYNEERVIGRVLDELKREGWKRIIVVDDGSTDATSKIAKRKGARILRHEKNLGLGAALRTGIEEAKKLGADVVVTFDADGQHDPKCIKALLRALKDADLVIGQRIFINPPLHKRIGNFILNLITRLFGGFLTDSQSGIRALNRRALERINIQSYRYEVSSEIVIQARQNKLKLREIPVKCRFTPYSKSRGTTIASGIRIFINLLKLKFQARI